MKDNFTDVNGTFLESHVPDGGDTPFSWQLTDSDPTVAQIQSNAVGYDQPAGWTYLTSVDAGDTAELEVDVFADPTQHPVQHDVGIVLRANPDASTFSKGYTIYWLIYGDGLGSDIAVDKPDANLLLQAHSAAPTAVGIHKFRAEIVDGGVINVYVDDALTASLTDPNPLPPGRAGISFFNGSTPSSVRITSFAATPAGTAELNVDCQPNPVERGQTVTCTASPPDQTSTITVSEWRFESADLSGPIVEASTATTWSGVAATGGTVRVQGTLDDAQADGEGPLTVAARDWSMELATYSHREVVPSGLPARPTRLGNLGNTGHATGTDLGPDKYAQITLGPNTGVLYVRKVPLAVRGDIRINRRALRFGSAFYFRQPLLNPPPGMCSQAEVVPFLPVVEQHEGLNREVNSHTYLYKQKLDELAGPATEAVLVLNDIAALADKAAAAGQPVFDAAHANSLRADGEFAPVYCLFRYF